MGEAWFDHIRAGWRIAGREFTEADLSRVHLGVQELVGDPIGDEDVVYALDTERVLVIRNRKAHIVIDDGETVTAEFYGDLRHGRYTERLSAANYGWDILLHFEHDRLPVALEEIVRVVRSQTHVEGVEARAERERALRLRKHFRRWATHTGTDADGAG